MTNDYRARIAEIDEYAVEWRALIPDSLAAFGALSKAAQSAGALDKKTKELLALAIGVAIRCDGCIGYHARGAQRTGARRQRPLWRAPTPSATSLSAPKRPLGE